MNDRQREMVGELVGTLYERGFARAVAPTEAGLSIGAEPGAEVARRFAAQIAYVDHYVDDAGRRFQKFRDARVVVVGQDAVARWCVLSLVRNGSAAIGVLPGLTRTGIVEAVLEARADGCPVDVHDLAEPTAGSGQLTWTDLSGYDVVVVTGGAEAPRSLLPLLRAGVPEGRVLLPAWSFGDRAVVGPSMSAATSGCWVCAVLRWGANDGAAEAADLWSWLALAADGMPARCGEPGASTMRPSTPAQEVRPGRPLAAMLGNLLGYEVFRLVTGALPAETAGKLIIQDVHSLDVTSEVLLPHPCCPLCADAAEAVVRDVRLPDEETSVTALSVLPTAATAREADTLIDELNRRSVLVQEHTGVFTRFDDETITQTPLKLSLVELGLGHGRRQRVAAVDVHHFAGARMRALHRAAEVYAEHVVPYRDAVATDSAVHIAPERLSTYAGFGAAADVREWMVATSLLTDERLLVPRESVHVRGAGSGERLFEATSSGTRASASIGGAAAEGLLSALAYDALQRTVRGTGAAHVLLDSVTDPELTFLVRSASNLGVDCELLDLGEQARSGVAAVLARSGTRWTLAAERTWQAAASAALRDLLGEVQAEQQGIGDGVSFGGPVLPDLDPYAIAVHTTVPAADTAATPWDAVLRRLGEQRRDALVVPLGSQDLERAGLHVVKVLLTSEAPSAG
ncbi:TOMM precursor leader peptide-binding protein [Streptomyces sp. T12]|uniref:TOMM precursor leader peptide-binding protein n=1 Tax=Streptomyces sp. T12 TaxID=477697 RepID=UPI0021BDD850|nr:TOMM precursor leader peptide-binding protein [Streptomyces sp. T12]